MEKKKPERQLKHPPQLPQKKEEKKKPEIHPKQPPQLLQKKQQQQQQQIKADDKKEKGKTALSKEDKELFGKLEKKYKFEWPKKRAGAVVTRVGDDIIFIRKIPIGAKGFAEYKDGPYLILKTNIEKFKKFKDNEVAKEKKKVDDIKFEYFNFSKEYFKDHEQLFADSLKQKKFLFDKLDDKEKKDVDYFGWKNFKDFDIIPSIKTDYINTLNDFNVETIQDNNFVATENAKEKKDLFDIGDEEPIQENEEDLLPKKTLPKKEEFEIEDDIDNSDSERMTYTDDDDIPEINVQEELKRQQEQQQQQRKQKRQRKQLIQAQNNQLINAGHTPNGEELKALIKYNNNSDSLLKLIVSLSENNKGEVDFKEIGEIQDLNGDITNLYSKMQELKSKINSSNNAEEKEKLLIKYNEKRLKLEDLIKKYSKEAYRLSTLKKKKATMATHKYLMNKLNKLEKPEKT